MSRCAAASGRSARYSSAEQSEVVPLTNRTPSYRRCTLTSLAVVLSLSPAPALLAASMRAASSASSSPVTKPFYPKDSPGGSTTPNSVEKELPGCTRLGAYT